MEKLYVPSVMGELMKRHNFHFTKSLGQNFLIDIHVIDKIIEGAEIDKEDLVIEIGPGIGTLTAPLAEKAKRVIAIELDKALIPILNETLDQYDNVKIINEDILKVDIKAILEEEKACNKGEFREIKILGNLPYYITTPIMMKIFEEGIPIESMIFMMQKEVAQRISARAGGKECGAISAVVEYYGETIHIANVSKEVFIPKPKVDSAVLRLKVRKTPPVTLKDEKLFFRIIKASFSQRRKTLLNSLSTLEEFSKEAIKDILEKAGIDGKRRGETLTLEELALIANEAFQSFSEKEEIL